LGKIRRFLTISCFSLIQHCVAAFFFDSRRFAAIRGGLFFDAKTQNPIGKRGKKAAQPDDNRGSRTFDKERNFLFS
jgi:hypothetical protein